MIRLLGQSIIMTCDEEIKIVREGTNIPGNVVYVDGKPIKRNGIILYARGNVQPLTARELLLVPEGDRFREQYYIFLNNHFYSTDEYLEVISNAELRVNDQINRVGVNFQVQEVENWGSYSRARIMRIDTGPDKTP